GGDDGAGGIDRQVQQGGGGGAARAAAEQGEQRARRRGGDDRRQHGIAGGAGRVHVPEAEGGGAEGQARARTRDHGEQRVEAAAEDQFLGQDGAERDVHPDPLGGRDFGQPGRAAEHRRADRAHGHGGARASDDHRACGEPGSDSPGGAPVRPGAGGQGVGGGEAEVGQGAAARPEAERGGDPVVP